MVGDENEGGRCTACGAALTARDARCWLCHRNVGEGAEENPYASPRPVAGAYVAGQFSLASLFLVMTLVAVGLGLFLIAPGLGVLFGFVATPALIRTVVATSRHKRAGDPLTALEKVESFIVSLFVMAAVWLASFVAFSAVCFAGVLVTGANSEASFLIGALVGLMAALPTAVHLIRRTQPGRLM